MQVQRTIPDVKDARKRHDEALNNLKRMEYRVRRARYDYKQNETPSRKEALDLALKRLDDAADEEWSALKELNEANEANEARRLKKRERNEETESRRYR